MADISRRQFLQKTCFLGSVASIFPGLTFCSADQESSLYTLEGKVFEPGYIRLDKQGELANRIDKLNHQLKECRLCPRECGVNRLQGEKGICQGGAKAMVATSYPHFGEERVLVGNFGSGTIFFSNCNLRCVFCINAEISQQGVGRPVSCRTLADQMIGLQKRGCKNINLVTPTHYVPQIVEAVQIASRKGLKIPLVYNTSAYEKVETLRLLRGIVDIYMPDLKFINEEKSARYSSGARDYGKCATGAIKEMFQQVGNLVIGKGDHALKGLIIRHLVMPNNQSDTHLVVKWIASNLPHSTYLNLMAQYRPAFKAFSYPKISRRLIRDEFQKAIQQARSAGLINLDRRSLSQLKYLKKKA